MTSVRAVLIGLEGEKLQEMQVDWPPPLVLEVAFLRPLRRVWEEGPVHDIVEFHYHRAHEIHEDGVETVALYLRRGIC